ncbi:MAG: MFS transporter, partial [Chlamydiota bacterium]
MKDRYTPFTIYSMFVATLASLCSGYNKGVMGGVLSSVKQEFQLTPIDESFLVSIALLGGTLGSLFCGYVSDKFGRKAGLTLTAIFFIIGGLVSAFSTTYSILCIGRFIIGMGLGTMLVVVPLYLVEISPELYRGRFVAFSSIMSSLGILLAYTISDLFEDVWNWRFILS